MKGSPSHLNFLHSNAAMLKWHVLNAASGGLFRVKEHFFPSPDKLVQGFVSAWTRASSGAPWTWVGGSRPGRLGFLCALLLPIFCPSWSWSYFLPASFPTCFFPSPPPSNLLCKLTYIGGHPLAVGAWSYLLLASMQISMSYFASEGQKCLVLPEHLFWCIRL